VEIHLTESDEENEEHKEREDIVEDRLEEPARRRQLRCHGEDEIDHRSHAHRHR